MRFLLFFSIVASALPSVVNAETMATVQSKELAYVLANFEVLAEAKHPESKGMFVRVLKVQDLGECDGSLDTCPKSTLYIAVSSYDEVPDQKVYQTPKGYNWKFDSWEKLPETDSATDYVQLRLTAQKPTKKQSKSGWVDEHYLLKLNYRDGSWLKQ